MSFVFKPGWQRYPLAVCFSQTTKDLAENGTIGRQMHHCFFSD